MADIQKDPVLEQIESLRAQVEYHADRYYNQDDPEISDFEYDKLFHQLLDLEEQNPQYYSPTSPTVRVGGHRLQYLRHGGAQGADGFLAGYLLLRGAAGL